MAQILHRLGYVRKGHLVAVTRDDLVGQYIGHTAPKTKEVLKRAMGGVLFIDEAYYLYRPENERDYGQEAIEILLQVMENQREDLVVIFAGYKDRMDTFFRSNPGMSSRVAHHIDFPDYTPAGVAFDRGPDARADAISARAREADEVLLEYIERRNTTTAFCQCPLGAQCPGSRPAAAGEPPVRKARRAVVQGGSDDHRSGGYPRQPGVRRISRRASRPIDNEMGECSHGLHEDFHDQDPDAVSHRGTASL